MIKFVIIIGRAFLIVRFSVSSLTIEVKKTVSHRFKQILVFNVNIFNLKSDNLLHLKYDSERSINVVQTKLFIIFSFFFLV